MLVGAFPFLMGSLRVRDNQNRLASKWSRSQGYASRLGPGLLPMAFGKSLPIPAIDMEPDLRAPDSGSRRVPSETRLRSRPPISAAAGSRRPQGPDNRQVERSVPCCFGLTLTILKREPL